MYWPHKFTWWQGQAIINGYIIAINYVNRLAMYVYQESTIEANSSDE